MLKTILAGALIAGFAMPAAAQTKATITKDAVGCPTIDGLSAAYSNAASKGSDLRSFRQILSTYECEWVFKGMNLTLIKTTPVVSLVIYPRALRSNKKLFVATHSISTN